MKNIAVIIPCYNESLSIIQVIDEVHSVLPSAKIYVFDNNSSDNSKALVENKILQIGGGGAEGIRAQNLAQILRKIQILRNCCNPQNQAQNLPRISTFIKSPRKAKARLSPKHSHLLKQIFLL